MNKKVKYLKYKKYHTIIIPLIIISFFVIVPDSFANNGYGGVADSVGGDQPVSLPNPLTGTATYEEPNVIIGKAINAVLGIVGSLALVMFIYGGILWMTAAGNDQRVQKGKDTLIWAVLGLIVIFMSYALVNFVLKDVIGGGGS